MIDLWVERADGHGSSPHTWLRERVAGSLGVEPDDVPLRVDDGGALSLSGMARQLSLSHHRDWLALALSTGEPVGVDVLTVPDGAEFVADTGLVLSPDEIEFVRSSPPARRGAVFAECWVRKEAYAKLRRTGLTAELPGMTLSPVPVRTSGMVFWTARIEDALVSVSTIGSRAPEIRLRSGHACAPPEGDLA
jgi:phosphopantetheinyl transferase